MPEADFAAAVERAAQAAELVNRTEEPDDRVTQFEALTAAAYHELARRGVEVAVIEAGLGGRFDATNVIPSKVQALTSVGLEHTRWLGPTLTDIAEEKLAVVRDHGTLVVGPLDPASEAVAERVAAERHATLVRAAADAGVPLLRAGWLPAPQLRARRSRRPRPSSAPARWSRRRSPRPRRETTIRGPRRGGRRAPADRLRRRPQPGGRAAPGGVARRRVRRPPPARRGDRRARGQGRRRHAAASCCRGSTGSSTRAPRNPRSLSPGTLGSLAEKLGGPPSEAVVRPARRGRPGARAGRPRRRRAGHRLDLPDRRPGAGRPGQCVLRRSSG